MYSSSVAGITGAVVGIGARVVEDAAEDKQLGKTLTDE